MPVEERKNMYADSKKQWGVFVGCLFDCVYCKKSFQAQMKRQMHRCMDCYNYTPHFHEERLDKKRSPLPCTYGDEFIWACASSDISFIKQVNWTKVAKRMRKEFNKQFLIQSKQAAFFKGLDIPENCWCGITLETNRDAGYENISKAPKPSQRFEDAKKVTIDIITVEPIQEFDLEIFVAWLKQLKPMRIYIGYDTKRSNLPEPKLAKTLQLIARLEEFTIVKPKLLRTRFKQNRTKQAVLINE